MKTIYNSQAFVPEEVEKGLHLKLVNFLLEQSQDMNGAYNDIHIWSDGYCTIVDWISVSFDDVLCEGKFNFVNEDEFIMKEIKFPDGEREIIHPYEEEDRMREWFKENPG